MAGPDGVSRVVQHNKYYLRGGDMTVLVENHLYRIHSYFFDRESLFFRQKFNPSNNTNNGEERGSTDNNAYTLEDVKSEDFARFLWVFYNERYSVYEAPLETWLSILKLANRWTFDSVKELSVRELEKIEIEAVEKISIYHDNNISRLYLLPSYIAVCKRDTPLTFREGMKLGMETVLRIAEARERLRLQASESGIRTPTFEDFEDTEVEVLIRDIFHLGSRPTSPAPATSPPNGINGAPIPTIKLNPAPVGNPPKANGASTPRANGGSVADPRGSSVNSLPSIASRISPPHQASATPAPPTVSPTVPETTGPSQGPRAQVPPAQAPLTVSASPQEPPPPPPASAKPKETGSQEPSNVMSPKSGGVGEPLSSGGSALVASCDVSISKPVVPTSERSNDLTAESTDNVNEGEKDEKDETGKDPDSMSVSSDIDTKGKTGTKNKRVGKQGGATRGGKK